jgi:predicted permease
VVRDPGAGSHGASRWLRVSLVTGEIGLAFVVVALAGLLVKSAARLDAADLGFSPAGVTLLKISLPTGRYPQADHRGAFFEALLGALRPHPAVEGAALADPAPLGGEAWSASVRVEGHEARPGEALPHAEFYRVSPGFARTLGLRLIDGREFGDRDDGRAPFVVMVDETFAARHWPGERAVGKRVNPRGPNAPWSTVVGVVARVRRDGPRHAGEPQVYLPYFQSRTGVMTLVVRSDLPAAGVIDIVRGVLRAIDPALPVSDVATLPELAARATAADRFALRLTAAFAVCALLLAAVGLYAVVAGLVTERTREIGIRLALGSPPGAILRGVVGQSGRWAAIGVVGGLAAAAAIGRAVRGLLFEVNALDAATLAAAVVVTLLVTLAATWFPARRAAALDPLAALRE